VLKRTREGKPRSFQEGQRSLRVYVKEVLQRKEKGFTPVDEEFVRLQGSVVRLHE
jgi:hypothetical protein